jgi:hypothetical protein
MQIEPADGDYKKFLDVYLLVLMAAVIKDALFLPDVLEV